MSDKIQPPDLDTRFCPACGGRDLEFLTVEELRAEDGESFKESDYFVTEGKVAWRCACGYEADLGNNAGIPTLRHLIEDEWWIEDVDVGRLVRWAVEAMRDKGPTTGSLPLASTSATTQQDFAPETPTLARAFGVDRQGVDGDVIAFDAPDAVSCEACGKPAKRSLYGWPAECEACRSKRLARGGP